MARQINLNDVRVLLREYVRKSARLGFLLSSYEATGVLTSLAPQGTAPLVVSSTTLVENLNAQYLSGLGVDDFVLESELAGDLVSEAIDDRVAQLIQDNTGISWTYDDGSGILTPTIDSSVLTPTHANLVGLTADDHPQYSRTDGTRNVTGSQTFESDVTVSGSGVFGGDVYAAAFFGDGSNLTGLVIDHDQLGGLGDDDHTQYARADGTRNVTGPQIFEAKVTAQELSVDTSGVFIGDVRAATFYGSGAGLTGLVADHDELLGLTDDDHPQYSRTDGTRNITGAQTFESDITVEGSGVVSNDLRVGGDVHATTFYGDGSKLDGIVLDHGGLTGLTDDDHPQYSRTDGTRNITGPQIFEDNVTISGTLNVPTAAVSGYHLVSDASGNASWQALPTTTIQTESFVATAAQTVFNLGFDYPLDGKSLRVYTDGLRMRPGPSNDYVETDTNTITFVTGRLVGSDIFVELVEEKIPYSVANADTVDTFHASQSYQANQIIALDTSGFMPDGLTVAGSIYADAYSSRSPLRLQTAGTTRIYADDVTGFVGIGTETPEGPLDIAGGAIVVDQTDSVPTPTTGRSALYVKTDGRLYTKDETGEESEIAASGAGHDIEDEGSPITQRSAMNFVGAGVTVTDAGGKTQVSISGGSGSFFQDTKVAASPSDKTIALTNTPIANSQTVIWNGISLTEGASNDYTISGTTITINALVEVSTGDAFLVVYAF